ncbi:hypothetical protein BHE74_00008019 [Ensete ventricosum]|nr:hypothetical protein BHE74_00008019 [Ensete ventricosum]
MAWSLPSAQARLGVSGLSQFSISGVCTSGWLLLSPVGAVSAEKNLHKGLIGMGVSDVTPPTFKSLLKMTGTMEKLKVELLAEAIVEYKKLACFEMGLVHTGQVLYEYVYRVALAQFKPDTPTWKLRKIPSSLCQKTGSW